MQTNSIRQMAAALNWPEGGLLRLAIAATLIPLLMLVVASRADAAYEQLPEPNGTFGGSPFPIEEGKQFPEEVQLGGTGAVDVNRTGAGGVPRGTLYAVTEAGGGTFDRVAMYEPHAGGGMTFVEGWKVARPGESSGRCGPLLGTETVDGKVVAQHPCPTRSEGSEQAAVGIGVDQNTGYVYVYSANLARSDNGSKLEPGNKVIVSYKADGSEEITRFGETAGSAETVSESEDKSHGGPNATDTLAVNGAGEVYLFDSVQLSREEYYRLMVFRPHEGDYTNFEYAGEVGGEADGLIHAPQAPTFDEAGNLYVASINASGNNYIEALAPETPGFYPTLKAPVRCVSKLKSGTIAMAVDPETGEPAYFSQKSPTRIRRLGPCDEASHEFGAQIEELAPEPAIEYSYALAFDPSRETSAARPDGALYAVSSGPGLDGSGLSALGYVFGHPEAAAPLVQSEWVSAASSSGAVVHAEIDPQGFTSHYVFQYITEAEYKAGGESFEGASEAPMGGGTIGASSGVQNVSIALGPLAADTAYRYRVVVSSECEGVGHPPCERAGEAKSFRTYPPVTSALPDGRVWELVSPVQKNGGEVLPADPSVASIGTCNGCKPGYISQHFPRQSAPDGNSIAYEGTAFGAGGAARANEYLARRDSSTGWQTTGLSPELGGGFVGFSPQLHASVLEPDEGRALTASAPEGYGNIYSQSTEDPLALQPLITAPPSNRGEGELKVRYAAASADGSRIFFAANDALTGETAYAPEAEDGGAEASNLYEWHEGRLALVNVSPDNSETGAGAAFGTASANTVSADGSHAFFEDSSRQAFVRIDGRETRRIEDAGHFLAASTDGDRLLLTDGCLYSVASESCLDLTEGKGGFRGEVGQSDSLDHVYFVDTEVLDATPNSLGEAPQAGANNLYAWQQGGQARFVTQLTPEKFSEHESTEQREVRERQESQEKENWASIPANRTAESSPDGRFVVFQTLRPLEPGYDNVGPCAGNRAVLDIEQGRCPEAYVYDSVTSRLVCASCNPSGSAPLGWTVLRRIMDGAAFPQPRYLTDAGRLYFDSEDSLSPLDTNEGFEDVYEWQPEGAGSCTRVKGCVSLISAGREAEDSNLVAINGGTAEVRAGADVFFTTRDRLVPIDKDELVDLYDAREGGGFPGETESQRSECQGEACQPTIAAPNDPTPGSSSFEGPGNVKESPKKPQHHKKKHHKKHHRQAKQNRGAHR